MLEVKTTYHRYLEHIIASQLSIPELPQLGGKKGAPTVSLKLIRPEEKAQHSISWHYQWREPGGDVRLQLAKDHHGYRLEAPDLASFTLSSDGSRIGCAAFPYISAAQMRHVLLDQVLPRYFVHFHNYTLLHASCVVKDGVGFCFSGMSGRGKSTLAAGFFKAGYSVLADDGIAIVVHNKMLLGVPGYGSLPVSKDMVSLWQADEPGAGVPEKNGDRKTSPQLGSVHIPCATLGGVFFLEAEKGASTTDTVEITRLEGGRIMQEILRNSFCLDPHDSRLLRRQFLKVGAIAATGVPFYRLGYPRNMQKLPEVVRAVEMIR